MPTRVTAAPRAHPPSEPPPLAAHPASKGGLGRAHSRGRPAPLFHPDPALVARPDGPLARCHVPLYCTQQQDAVLALPCSCQAPVGRCRAGGCRYFIGRGLHAPRFGTNVTPVVLCCQGTRPKRNLPGRLGHHPSQTPPRLAAGPCDGVPLFACLFFSPYQVVQDRSGPHQPRKFPSLTRAYAPLRGALRAVLTSPEQHPVSGRPNHSRP